MFFFMPSPALLPHVGKQFQRRKGGPAVCDAYGDELCAAMLTGNGMQIHHDCCVRTLVGMAMSAGVRVQEEVYNVFSPAVPEAHRVAVAKQQQGKIPDIIMHLREKQRDANGGLAESSTVRPCMMELKTIHYGPQRYGPARDGSTMAVDKRARTVPREYDTALKKADVKWCGTSPDGDEIGPMRAVLRAHGRLRALVFGCVAEASKDVHALIRNLAQEGARNAETHRPRNGRAKDKGTMAWYFKRTLGCAVWRSELQMMLDRLVALDPNAET